MRGRRVASAALAACSALAGCAGPATPDAAPAAAPAPATTSADRAPADADRPPVATSPPGRSSAPLPAAEDPPPPSPTAAFARPDWLGQRPLPVDDHGFGQVLPTPPELVDRRLATVDVLPPPPDDAFHSQVVPVPEAVLARSTWHPGCPVAVAELRYVTVSFWGFDERSHTGELLVNAEVADDVVIVFERLHQARFPIEEMRITRADELDLPPTGDGNNTGAFVCRAARGSGSWSEHAYGLAIDINPFHNPYQRDALVLPELASAYLDRHHVRPGMILPGDAVTTAFAQLGWEWGGTWRSLVDHQHFSRHGG